MDYNVTYPTILKFKGKYAKIFYRWLQLLSYAATVQILLYCVRLYRKEYGQNSKCNLKKCEITFIITLDLTHSWE